uniref:Uncharacterized protein n=1 Tax=Anguilla anguilla TaxID=7936 RepID=A0A0E9PYC3_ANGAN
MVSSHQRHVSSGSNNCLKLFKHLLKR